MSSISMTKINCCKVVRNSDGYIKKKTLGRLTQNAEDEMKSFKDYQDMYLVE